MSSPVPRHIYRVANGIHSNAQLPHLLGLSCESIRFHNFSRVDCISFRSWRDKTSQTTPTVMPNKNLINSTLRCRADGDQPIPLRNQMKRALSDSITPSEEVPSNPHETSMTVFVLVALINFKKKSIFNRTSFLRSVDISTFANLQIAERSLAYGQTKGLQVW